MTNFDIKIVSDNVCPFCYLGKKRLEKAISAYKAKHPGSDDTFTTTWYPFYLNPHATRMDKMDMYSNKFGEARTRIIQANMTQTGLGEGINFKWGGKTGPTRDSHRLVQLGKTKSPQVQTRVIEELFAAYFENEKDITSRDVLVEAAVKAGIDQAEANEWLEDGNGGSEVDKEVQKAVHEGISGVPNFKINDRFEISGAQEPAAFVQMFERLKKLQGTL
ncbi:thioredoxin-like protein [Pleomassaria siparia CBS 279.74]|uniref:Thioredoxin-like protein n=1 Tax=Pleomassaria siparia CBS 279.74 TaxID=1314801 RepID=A0A6G1JRL4_9PLEO|nr:thioredoxin-like protein [Pleomassaria siparia CBS 279.74]